MAFFVFKIFQILLCLQDCDQCAIPCKTLLIARRIAICLAPLTIYQKRILYHTAPHGAHFCGLL